MRGVDKVPRVLFDEAESLYRQLKSYIFILTKEELESLKGHINTELEDRELSKKK